MAARGGGAIAARRFDVFGGTLILKHCSVRGVDHPGGVVEVTSSQTMKLKSCELF